MTVGCETKREQNIRSVVRSVEKLNSRDFHDYMEDYSSDFVMYVNILKRPVGRQGAFEFMKEYVRMFPGVVQSIDEIFANSGGDRLVYRFTARADSFKGFRDLPPLHGPVRFEGVTFYEFKGGLRTRSWSYFDIGAFLVQESSCRAVASVRRNDSEANIRHSIKTLEDFNARDFSDFYANHSPDYTMYGDTLPRPVVGIRANKKYIEQFIHTFPDIQLNLQETAAYENQVFVRFVASGTETRGFLGLPPIKRPYEFHAVFINFFDHGVRTMTWQYFDQWKIVRQMWPGAERLLPSCYGSSAGQSERGCPKSAPNLARAGSQQESAIISEYVRLTANFVFTFGRDGNTVARPKLSQGEWIGFDVHRRVDQLGINKRIVASRSPRIDACPTGRMEFLMQFVPDDYVAKPGIKMPSVPVDENRSQRFVVENGLTVFDHARRSSFRFFGTGRTFPSTADGRAQLQFGAVLDVGAGSGSFARRHGMLAACGRIEPPSDLEAVFLLRFSDPLGELTSESASSPSCLLAGSDPEALVLTFIGEQSESDPVGTVASGGTAGAGGTLILKLIDVRLGCEDGGIVTSTTFGQAVGTFHATARFNPEVGSPPYPFQSTNGLIEFHDRDGKPIGGIEADMVEGRMLPTAVPGVATPIYRVGSMAPFIRGTGCFSGVVGIVMANALISIEPFFLSDMFLMRASDPRGELRSNLFEAWGLTQGAKI